MGLGNHNLLGNLGDSMKVRMVWTKDRTKTRSIVWASIGLMVIWAGLSVAQINSSGGSSVVLTAGTAIAGKFGIDQTTPGTTNGVQINAALPAGANLIGKFGIDQTTPGATNAISMSTIGATAIATSNGVVGAGVERMAIASDNTPFRVLASPAGCSAAQVTLFTSQTVGVATGAGTSITSTSTCLTNLYVNNITNAPVTLRLQDKTGTPIIWLGGNADFTIGANGSGTIHLEGITFNAGMTAIAGTASALNLAVTGLQ
jgi:hypothetical protein